METKLALFDAAIHDAEDDKSRDADEWFRTLEDTIHSPIFSTPQDHQRVCIAIVGAGIDSSHPEIRKALEEQRIVECRGFPETLEPLRDSHGYGTYCVSVTLRTMPWVSLYVARVVNDEGDLVEDDDCLAVAQAIEWAVKMKVDIISIPWGIKEESGNICIAVAEANKAGISVFAAGPNAPSGRNDPFPASLNNVVSIGSSDGLGEPSHPSLRYISNMFCAVGEAVMGANPGVSENGTAQPLATRRDGASVATCVATGLTAMLFDYARRYLDVSRIKPIEVHGIFRGMSEATTQKFYRYISPWGIFGPSKDTKETLKEILKIVAGVQPVIPMQSKLFSSSIDSPMCVLSPSIEPCNNYIERQTATFADIRRGLTAHSLIYITGKPGMGKTQLVKEYVHRAREARWYKGFFWVDVGTDRSVRNGLHHLIVSLKIGKGGGENAIAALKRELSQQFQWLLVIDDSGNTHFDIVSLFSGSLNFMGHIIVIVQRDTPIPPPPGAPIPPVPIGLGPPVPIAPAVALQLGPPPIAPLPVGPPLPPPLPVLIPAPIPIPPVNNLPMPAPIGPLGAIARGPPTPPITVLQPVFPQITFHLGSLDARDSEDLFTSIYSNGREGVTIPPIDALLDELGHVPLSIEIAATYLREAGDDVATYIHQYTSFKEQIAKHLSAQGDSYISAASALAISLQKLESCPETLRLLCLLAFLDHSCIQLWIFTADPRFRDVPLRRIFSSQEVSNDTVLPLLLYGLVKVVDNNHSISMNRVLQAIVRDFIELESGNGKAKSTPLSITDESPIYWIERATELMYICYPTTLGAVQSSKKIHEFLNPHVIEVVQHCESYAILTKEYGMLQASLGSYVEPFEPEAAMILYYRALQTFEALYGADHIATSQIVEIITGAAHFERKYEIALKYNERAMEIQEGFFGTNHYALLPAILERGNIYISSGKTEEAIFQFRWFVRVCEKAIGVSSVRTRDAHFVLSREYYRQGKYVEGRKQVDFVTDSSKHPLEKAPFDILWVIKYVARCSLDQKKYNDAIAQFKRVLDIHDKSPATPVVELKDTLRTLASLYNLNKDYNSALELYERLLKVEEEDEDANPKDVARTIGWIANVYVVQRNYEKAIELNERQLSILEDKFGVDTVETTPAIRDIAYVYERQKKLAEALERYRRVVRIYEAEYGPNATILFDGLGAISRILFLQRNIADSLSTDLRSLQFLSGGVEVVSAACAYERAAVNNQWLGKFDTALALSSNALTILQSAFGTNDVRTTWAMERMAYLHGIKRNFQTAWTTYQSILSIKDAAFGKDSLNHCTTLSELARFYHQQAKYDEALEICERILRIQRAALPTENTNMAETIREIGHYYDHKGKYDLALKHKLSALRMEEKSEDCDVISLAQLNVSIGYTYISMGKYDEALREFRKSLEIREKALGPDHYDVADSHEFIGDVYYEQMNYDDAMAAYSRGLTIKETSLGRDNRFIVRTLTRMGKASYAKGDTTAAMEFYLQAIRVIQNFYGAHHVVSIDTMMNTAIGQCKLGLYETAISTLLRALDVAEMDYGPGNPETSELIMNLAVVYMYNGRYDKAIRRLRQALALLEKAFGEGHPNTAETLMNMGRVLQRQKRYSEADECIGRCRKILHQFLGPDHPRTKRIMNQVEELFDHGDEE